MTSLHERSAGILLHITSLPGAYGIGDFGPESRHFVDWLVAAGQRIWQVLPTTPIGPANSPYQGVSAFAGSQWMVALEPLIARGWLEKPQVPDDGFNAHAVDYRRVLPWRETQLRAAATGFFSRGSKADRNAFDQWRINQTNWLDDYALFMAIRSPRNGQPWWDWPAPLASRQPAALAAARVDYVAEILFWQFVQWNFDMQVIELKNYANERGVSIMGDLPIFVAHDSADCWSRPDLYFLDEKFDVTVVAGVPPDSMSTLGQRWGNPLYRWDRMAAENFSWWVARIRRALLQSDIIRIDHFRGFAGYYEIPASSQDATNGRWVPAPGQALFSAIESALGKLPIVAEDLGLITPDVIQLRDGFGLPGMRILQFAFGGDGSHEFLPHNYVANTVVYSGTHDNDTARGWWDSASTRERAFAGSYLAANTEDFHWALIRAACNSVANLAVFPLQDVLGLDGRHRMNTPGTGDGNWSWRFQWDMVGTEPARVLGVITAASGRGQFNLLGLQD